MHWFLKATLIGVGFGIGFTVSIVLMGYGFQKYVETQIVEKKGDDINEKNEFPITSEEVAESYENEKLDLIYKKAEKYRWGYGVDKNHAEAAKWYLEAAEKGHDESQLALAYLYRDGYGVEKNAAEAVRWMKAAKGKGNTEAAGALGYMYLNGRGVDKNFEAAYELLLESANAGHGFAMGNLGWMYERGMHVQRSNVLAREWYEKGEAAGDDYSMRKLRDGW